MPGSVRVALALAAFTSAVGAARVLLILTGHDGDTALTALFTGLVPLCLLSLTGLHVVGFGGRRD